MSTASRQAGAQREPRGTTWAELHSWKARAECAGSIALQSAKDLLTDSGPQWAAALAYYSLLSAIPLLVLIAAVAAYFVDPQWAVDHATKLLGNYLPEGKDQLQGVVKSAIANRGRLGIFAFLGLLWTGTRVFSTLTKALNVANERSQQYGFFKRLLVEAALLLTVGAVIVLALLAQTVIDVLAGTLEQIPANPSLVFQTVEWLVRVVLLGSGYFLIYQFVPQGKKDWHASLAGAATATVIFAIADPIFQYYVGRSQHYNVVYGSLAIVVVVLIWVWLVSLITLFGGEVAAHVRGMALEGQSAGEIGRRHQQRATPPPAGSSNTVGEAVEQGADRIGRAAEQASQVGERVKDTARRATRRASPSRDT